MFRWSLILSLLWAAMVCCNQLCGLPDPHSYCNGNKCAPNDRLVGGNSGDTCRTNLRFRGDHNLPSAWVLMFDSYDYQTLVGPALLSREFDSDGDVSVRVYTIMVTNSITAVLYLSFLTERWVGESRRYLSVQFKSMCMVTWTSRQLVVLWPHQIPPRKYCHWWGSANRGLLSSVLQIHSMLWRVH